MKISILNKKILNTYIKSRLKNDSIKCVNIPSIKLNSINMSISDSLIIQEVNSFDSMPFYKIWFVKIKKFFKNIIKKLFSSKRQTPKEQPITKPKLQQEVVPETKQEQPLNAESTAKTNEAKSTAAKETASVKQEEPLCKIVENQYGEKYYQKLEKEKSQKAYFVSKLYNILNAKTPDIHLLGNSFSPKGMESKFIENLRKIDTSDSFVLKKISKDFGADVLVANRDILKSCKVDPQGNVIRVRLSDTLGIKPNGESSHFSCVVDEIADYFNPELYPQNAQAYKNMSREDFISSLKKVLDIDKIKIERIHTLNEYSDTLNKVIYTNTLLKRKAFIKRAINAAENIEQDSLSIGEYAEKIKNEALRQTILKGKQYLTLKDVKLSVEKIKNPELKQELTHLLEERIKELTPNTPNQLTIYEAGELLEKFSTASYKMPEKEYEKLQEQFGTEYANRIKYLLKKPLSSGKIKEITQIANINNAQHLEFWRNNPDKMALYINANTTTSDQLIYYNEKAWNAVIGRFKALFEVPNPKNSIAHIIEYSGCSGYDQYNGLLRFEHQTQQLLNKLNENYTPEQLKGEANAIENITQRLYIGNSFDDKSVNSEIIRYKTQKLVASAEKNKSVNDFKNALVDLKKTINNISKNLGYNEKIKTMEKLFTKATEDVQDLKLRRISKTDELEQLELDGKKLSDLMIEARNNPELVNRILKYFNEQKPTIYDPAFTSTSISPYKTLAGNVDWNLKMKKDVKYTYVSDISHLFDYNSEKTEAEILIFPNHKRKITSANYDKGKWFINAETTP